MCAHQIKYYYSVRHNEICVGLGYIVQKELKGMSFSPQ